MAEKCRTPGVPPQTIVNIARQQHITPDSFAVLDKMEEIKDPDGKSFFLMPKGASPDDIRRATLMTYILNCGTDYGSAGQQPGVHNDFPETPYSAAEVDRIARRQMANGWSYAGAWAVEHTGGSLVTTPNRMLMGLGGKIQDTLSCQGGTTYGDIFMVNIDHCADPAQQLRDIVHSGWAWDTDSNGNPIENRNLDLDRLLHHEERHSQQYARFGPLGMAAGYAEEEIRRRIFGGFNWFRERRGFARRRLPVIRRSGVLVALLVILLAGCPNKAPWAPSLPVAFGARVTDGRLQQGTGSRCVGVARLTLYFNPNQAQLELRSPNSEAVEVDRLALGGPYPPGLTVAQPLPPGFDWRTEETVHFGTTGGSSRWGATTRLAEVIKGSPEHPADTYWFQGVGWLNSADVAAKDGKTFLGLCTRDPAKKPATTG